MVREMRNEVERQNHRKNNKRTPAALKKEDEENPLDETDMHQYSTNKVNRHNGN